jgi:peptidoglycan/xylan/chitin deacetylase (PgdA/CDA1 family)
LGNGLVIEKKFMTRIQIAMSEMISRLLSSTSKILILLYHQINERKFDPHGLCVSPQNFSDQLECLKCHYSILSLEELYACLKKARLPKRGIVVTFDDGYADNLYCAKNLLAHHKIPATFFITTSLLDSPREFWWDELEKIVFEPKTLPRSLNFSSKQEDYCWELNGRDDECGNEERRRLYEFLYPKIRNADDPQKRQEVLGALVSWSGVDISARQTHRILSSEELIRLADDPLIQIGSHTATHLALSKLPEEKQKEEICRSKSDLIRILKCKVNSFSYPFGQKADFSQQTMRVIRDAGFDYACAAFGGGCKLDTDYYCLPRFAVKNWDMRVFKNKLTDWFAL